MRTISRALPSVLIIFTLSVFCSGQNVDRSDPEVLQKRITDLESQLKTVVEQLAELKTAVADAQGSVRHRGFVCPVVASRCAASRGLFW